MEEGEEMVKGDIGLDQFKIHPNLHSISSEITSVLKLLVADYRHNSDNKSKYLIFMYSCGIFYILDILLNNTGTTETT